MSPSLRKTILHCALIASTWSVASVASDNSAPAQALFDEGKKLMTEGKYADACPKFAESQRLDPGMGTLLNLADCSEHEGKIATAWSKFLEAADMARAAKNSQTERLAQDRAAALAPRVPKILVNVASSNDVAGFDLQRDGIAVGKAQWGIPVPVDSGSHELVASAPGHKAWRATISIPSGGETTGILVPVLELTSDAAASEPPTGLPTQRIVALSAAGAGAVALAVSGILALSVKAKMKDANATCPAKSCGDENAVAQSRDAVTAGKWATAAFIVGAVGVGTGAALWFTAKPRSEANAAPVAELGLGVGTVQVRGAW